MKLKRLILQGFKSFRDKTTIHFEDGITGIVGPNGCGKSNIVDALFWVMGEMSAKHLRGTSMKDVIFAGSAKFSPASWAEVSLVLDNEEGKHIHIGGKVSSPSEIKLTRKLYRNGESEYRINGIPARLKDIQEIFMDTGAGAKSYSIIAQGEINKLVQSKPIERRTMIEEVAGITKFKMRRRESMKKIEQTEENLRRIDDLQSEIYKNLKLLEKQAQKAERAKTLKERIKRNELIVLSHKQHDLLKSYRDSNILLTEKKVEVEEKLQRKNVIEMSLQDERLKKDEMTETLDKIQKEYNEKSKLLAGAEEKLSYSKQNLEEKTLQLEKCVELQSEVKEEIAARTEKKIEIEKEIESLQEEDNNQDEINELEEVVAELKSNLEDREASLSDLSRSMDELKREETKRAQDVERNEHLINEAAKSLEDISTEIEAIEKETSKFSTRLIEEREEVQRLEQDFKEIETNKNNQIGIFKELKEKFQELDQVLREKNKEKIKVDSKLTSLKELSDGLQTCKAGVQNFFNADESNQHKILGNIIECEENYVKAVQNVLQQYFNAIVGPTDKIIDWSTANPEEAIEFIQNISTATISNEDVIERLEVAGLKDIRPLKDVVRFNEESLKETVSPILDGYFLVEDLNEDHFGKISTDISFRGIVSTDGRLVILNNGVTKTLYTAGHLDQSVGIVERNNKIKELSERSQELDLELTKMSSEIDEIEVNRNEAKAKLQELDRSFDQIKFELTKKKSALDSKTEVGKGQDTRLNILKSRKTEVSATRLDLLEKEESIKKSLEDLKAQVEESEAQFEIIETDVTHAKEVYADKHQYFMDKQIAAKTWQTRFDAMKNQANDIDEQVLKMQARLENAINDGAALEETLDDLRITLEELAGSNIEIKDELQTIETDLSERKDVLAVLLVSMQDREDEAKKLTADINKSEKIIVENQVKLEQYVEEEEQLFKNCFEKYRVNLRSAISEFLELNEEFFTSFKDISDVFTMEGEEGQVDVVTETYHFTKRYPADVKDCRQKLAQYKSEYSRLGEINWQAIEDYQRQKHRYDFLREQETELKASLDDLMKAIEYIDVKSKRRFSMAFEEVNTRFQKVFPIIFGGGNAHLKVIGDIDSPECGIDIIAQPPGKKMQNINLMSGGEKAMTAVSLIFSIFLVKPSPFCLLDEVDAPLDDANVGRFNDLLREMSSETQFILITHNKKTMELNDKLYGVTMQEPGISKAVSVQVQ